MSIEELFKAVVAALEANTKAVAALEASLAGRTPSKSAKAAKAEGEKFIDAFVEEISKTDPKTEVVEEKKPDPKVEESNTASDAVAEVDCPADEVKASLPYETARALVLKLANAGKRAEIPQVFKAHGIDNLKKLLDKEDDFSTVNNQAKLEAVYADLQKLEG
jgi:hypothetical protein